MLYDEYEKWTLVNPLITQATLLFREVTLRLNALIEDCRAKRDFSLHRAERRRLERLRRKAYKRWVRRGGPSTIRSEDYDYEVEDQRPARPRRAGADPPRTAIGYRAAVEQVCERLDRALMR